MNDVPAWTAGRVLFPRVTVSSFTIDNVASICPGVTEWHVACGMWHGCLSCWANDMCCLLLIDSTTNFVRLASVTCWTAVCMCCQHNGLSLLVHVGCIPHAAWHRVCCLAAAHIQHPWQAASDRVQVVFDCLRAKLLTEWWVCQCA